MRAAIFFLICLSGTTMADTETTDETVATTVTAPEATTVSAPEATTVAAPEATTVIASDASTVAAPEATTVIASDASTVAAPEATTVIGSDASTVTASDDSTVTASGDSTITVSEAKIIELSSDAPTTVKADDSDAIRELLRKKLAGALHGATVLRVTVRVTMETEETAELRKKIKDAAIKGIVENILIMMGKMSVRTKREDTSSKKIDVDVSLEEMLDAIMAEKITMEDAKAVDSRTGEEVEKAIKDGAVAGAKKVGVLGAEAEPFFPEDLLNRLSIALIVVTCVLFVACLVIGLTCFFVARRSASSKYYAQETIHMGKYGRTGSRYQPNVSDQQMMKGDSGESTAVHSGGSHSNSSGASGRCRNSYTVNGNENIRQPKEECVVHLDHVGRKSKTQTERV